MAPRPKVKPNPLDAKWVVLGREEKLVQLMKENGWEIADETSIPKMVLTTKEKDAKNLAKEYGRLWESMNKFFCFIGDYRSAILVNRTVCSTTPPHWIPCPSVRISAICVTYLAVQFYTLSWELRFWIAEELSC
jgi:hypothetical protein